MSERPDEPSEKQPRGAHAGRWYSGTRANRKRRDQTDSSSVGEYKRARPGRSETRKNHKAKRESSCEGRLEDPHHKVSHNLSSNSFLAVATRGKEKHSTFQTGFKTTLQGVNMEGPSQNQEKGVTGLMNMRNTCYMNSALQAIRHNTEISAFFLEHKHEQWVEKKPGSPKVELVKGYADLLRALWSGSKPAYVRPEGFLGCMHRAALDAGFDQFTIPVQHDSHEFLTFLMDQIHEGMAEEVNIDIKRPAPETPKDKAIQSALEAWKQIFGKSYSPLTEMIYGLVRVSYVCTQCQNCVDKWETFNCLKVPIPTAVDISGAKPTLQTMVAAEFHEESIEGYACEKCSPTRTTVLRKPSLWRLPRMVVLSLKRFTPDGRKIHTPIEFSIGQTVNLQSLFSTDSPEPSQHQEYECFATVDHHGIAGGGHYTAQAKSPLSEKWNLFDDETAHSISEPQFGESTYMIFLKPVAKAKEA